MLGTFSIRRTVKQKVLMGDVNLADYRKQQNMKTLSQWSTLPLQLSRARL